MPDNSKDSALDDQLLAALLASGKKFSLHNKHQGFKRALTGKRSSEQALTKVDVDEVAALLAQRQQAYAPTDVAYMMLVGVMAGARAATFVALGEDPTDLRLDA